MTGHANFRLTDESETLSERAKPYAPQPMIARQVSAEIRAELARREQRIDLVLQTGIAVLTFAALWLLTSGAEYARWGHVVGLVSQPFYIAAAWRGRQWGMFVVAIALCGLWLRGITNHFF